MSLPCITPAAATTDCICRFSECPSPCLLHVCSDVAVPSDSARYQAAAKRAESRTKRHRQVLSGSIWTLSSGLLIRGFGVQVPGGAPGLTWGFIIPDHFFRVRFVHMFAPCLLGRTDPAIRVLSKTAHPAPDTGARATGSVPHRPADAAPPPPFLRPWSTRPMV